MRTTQISLRLKLLACQRFWDMCRRSRNLCPLYAELKDGIYKKLQQYLHAVSMITSEELTLSPDKIRSTNMPPIRLGLLGLNFGEHIATKILKNVDCLKVVGVCELDQAKLRRVAEGLGVKAYSELDAMLADPEIEAVAVFTGSPGRAKLISKILKQKRHVLTTKPFELELSEAASVLQEAQDQGIVVHLNSPGPEAADDIAIIQTWIKQHHLGRPIGFHARTSANYREKPNGSW